MTKSKSKQNPKRRRITLSLEAPQAGQVHLMGDFNRWNAKFHSMKKDENGLWNKIVVLTPGRYEYKFLVDGQWQNDPRNVESCYNCFGTHNNILNVSPK